MNAAHPNSASCTVAVSSPSQSSIDLAVINRPIGEKGSGTNSGGGEAAPVIAMAATTPTAIPPAAATSSSAPAFRADVPRVVVIGGGFGGTMTAVHLTMHTLQTPMHITLINAGSPFAQGVAYSTVRAEHLLNVPAYKMSAFPEKPNHFVEWIRRQPWAIAEDQTDKLLGKFMSRQVYGQYLRSIAEPLIRPATSKAASGAASAGTLGCEFFDLVDSAAVDVEATSDGRMSVLLANGQRLQADKVVLATGNEAPVVLPGAEQPAVAQHPSYHPNPWAVDWSRLSTKGGTARIVLLGTGLTTVDCIITLLTLGWEGEIHAISRHALLPVSHFVTQPVDNAITIDFPPANVSELGLESLAKLLIDRCRQLDAGSPELKPLLVEKMRPYTQSTWRNFSPEEKVQFANQYAARWNTIRHRIAPSLHAQVQKALASGKLHLHAGSIVRVGVAHDPSQLCVELCALDAATVPPSEALSSVMADMVINCTGPSLLLSQTKLPLLQQALKRGLLQQDDIGMGLRVNPDDFSAELLLRQSDDEQPIITRSPHFYAIGPLLRGTLWETFAVAELRAQAQSVASTIAKDVTRK